MDSAELAALDRRVLWHPFTQQRGWEDEEPPVVIASAQGTNLVDVDGRNYLDLETMRAAGYAYEGMGRAMSPLAAPAEAEEPSKLPG